jgi:ribosomal protein S18 acetylase RimI-like enzyme
MNEFISFPFQLYRGSPFWTPPLRMDERATFSRKKNPVFRDGEAKFWLARREGRVVGRIAGIISRPYIAKWKNNYARFGWLDFEDDPEILAALTGAVESWARENRMSAVHGPLGFTDFDPEGMLVEGFDLPASMTTIYNHSYYPRYLEALGYGKDADWLEYEIAIPEALPSRMTAIAERVAARYGLRSLDARRAKDLLPYTKGIFRVLEESYAGLYGVVKLTDEQIDNYTKQYFSFIQPEFVSVVLDREDAVAAFAISMPSLTKALQRSRGRLFPFGFIHVLRAFRKNDEADLYLIAVRPDLQSKGVNAMLLCDLGRTFIKRGIKKVHTHPVLETNVRVPAQWKELGSKSLQRRRCYIKHLSL